jgi:hypothetical protein
MNFLNKIAIDDPRIIWEKEFSDAEKREIVAKYAMPGDRMKISPKLPDKLTDAERSICDHIQAAGEFVVSRVFVNDYLEVEAPGIGRFKANLVTYPEKEFPICGGIIHRNGQTYVVVLNDDLKLTGGLIQVQEDIGRHVIWNYGAKKASELHGMSGEFHIVSNDEKAWISASPWNSSLSEAEIKEMCELIDRLDPRNEPANEPVPAEMRP